ncbi:helix-turn-helix transcriptional regulator [Aegicerativicinus sediminis]
MVNQLLNNTPFYVSVYTTDAIHSLDHGQLTLFKQRLYNSIEKSIISNEGQIEHQQPTTYLGSFSSASDAIFAALQIKRKSKYNLTSINKVISDIEIIVFEKSEIDLHSELDRWICKFVNYSIVATSAIEKHFYKNNTNLKLDKEEVKVLRDQDFKFLKALFSELESNFNSPFFDVNELCEKLKLPYSKVYSVITRLMHRNPSSIIRDFRLHKSLIYIEKNSHNIKSIAKKSGFSDASYYAKSFKNVFGISPSRLKK